MGRPAPAGASCVFGWYGDTKISVDYQKLDGRRSQWDTKFSGVRNILYERYSETTNENTKARLEKYIREEPCSSCHGARLRPEMLAVTVGGKSHLRRLLLVMSRVARVF